MYEKLRELEAHTGTAQTYLAASFGAVVTWLGSQNWLLILSAVALIIRIGIDLPKLCKAWSPVINIITRKREKK